MPDDKTMYMLAYLIGLPMAGFAVVMTIIGLVCTVSACRNKFPITPIVFFWTAISFLFLIGSLHSWWLGFVVYTFIAPVMAVLFWYYDKHSARFLNSNKPHAS